MKSKLYTDLPPPFFTHTLHIFFELQSLVYVLNSINTLKIDFYLHNTQFLLIGNTRQAMYL